MPFNNATMGMDGPAPRRRRRDAVETEQYFLDHFGEEDDGSQGELGHGVSSENDLAEVVSSLTVAEVVELVESGEADLESVIEAEKVGKNRKTVLSLVQGESGKVYPVSQTAGDHSATESNENPIA